MEERTTNEVVQDVMEDIAARREAAQETAKEEKTLAEQFSDSKAEQAQPEGKDDGPKKMDEITSCTTSFVVLSSMIFLLIMS